MLTQEFDRETTRYLSDILAQENTTRDELIRNLIRDRWLLLHQHGRIASRGQTNPTQTELSSSPDPSESQNFETSEPESPLTQARWLGLAAAAHRPKNAKQALADFVKRRNQRVCVF
jgi:hypothetical protein